MRGANLSQYRQRRRHSQAHCKGIEPGLAAGKVFRHQSDEDVQRLMDGPHAPAHPAQYPRQLDIRAQLHTGRFQARGLLYRTDDLLELGQGAGQACRQTIGQQAEGAMSELAVPAGDTGSGRGRTGIGPVAGEPAAAFGV